MITSDDVRRRLERDVAQVEPVVKAAAQPAGLRDSFLLGEDGPNKNVSVAAHQRILRGEEICSVSVVKRGAKDAVYVVAPDELDALEAKLGEDPEIDHIIGEQGVSHE